MQSISYQKHRCGLTIALLALACFVCNGLDCKAAPVVLHLEGNVEDAGGPQTTANCTGNGSDDIIVCDGPIMNGTSALSAATAASWTSTSGLDGTNPRTIYDPSWVWTPPNPVSISNSITVKWWASCNACTTRTPAGEAMWNIRLFTNTAVGATPVFEQMVTATPAAPNVPSLLTATINLPTPISIDNALELIIDPISITSQATTRIFYDSTLPCPGVAELVPCDSTLTVNTVTTAAQSSIRGKVTNKAGRGLANVTVFLSSADGASQFVTRTDLRGFYVVENVPTGLGYMIHVRRKGYRFLPDNQFLSLNGDETDVDFVGGTR
ncbi:MAG: carboxypeptidase regulatory-like domain-containing protein [Pyrinomonadaceae bacterium]|nr:carboxypeptidase regulatory-like domain-containing protein [Pyrinomonadaceae bacterium]